MVTTYIKMKPYLKEFVLGLETKDGQKLYGEEPVVFPEKDRLRLLLDRHRRKPGPNCIQGAPLSPADRINYLHVQVIPYPHVRQDDSRTYLSPDAQSHISSYVYDLFCMAAFEFVNQHLLLQQSIFPGRRPIRYAAYRDFCIEYKIEHADEESIRRAFNRQKKMFTMDDVRKKIKLKENIWYSQTEKRCFQPE